MVAAWFVGNEAGGTGAVSLSWGSTRLSVFDVHLVLISDYMEL